VIYREHEHQMRNMRVAYMQLYQEYESAASEWQARFRAADMMWQAEKAEGRNLYQAWEKESAQAAALRSELHTNMAGWSMKYGEQRLEADVMRKDPEALEDTFVTSVEQKQEAQAATSKVVREPKGKTEELSQAKTRVTQLSSRRPELGPTILGNSGLKVKEEAIECELLEVRRSVQSTYSTPTSMPEPLTNDALAVGLEEVFIDLQDWTVHT